jgi:hypothetical protein
MAKSSTFTGISFLFPGLTFFLAFRQPNNFARYFGARYRPVNPLSCYLRVGFKVAIVTSAKGLPNLTKKTQKKKTLKKTSRMSRDRRRKHHHWQVTVYYADGEKFARVYIDRDRAQKFAERQKKSPVVKSTRIMEVD